MKFFLIYFLLLANVSMLMARKRHKAHREGDDDSIESARIDLRGTLRKYLYLFSALRETKENIACSPLSALMPLGKLALGAVDNTLSQLLYAIGITGKEQIREHFKPLISEMRYLPGVILTVASKVYVNQNLKLKKEFKDNAQEIFSSSVDQLDFSSPKASVGVINKWVSSETNGTIQEILTETDINSDSSVVIVNAVYFKGKWETPFKNAGTARFFSTYETVNITMMERTAMYNYTSSKELDARIVQVPYAGGRSNFLVVVPNTIDSVPDLLKKLASKPSLMDSAMKNLSLTHLSLKLPIFKVESKLNLKKVLKEIGIRQMFTYNSGLKDIVEGSDVVVSQVTQKTFIEVNEEGTTAAAATVVAGATSSYTSLQLHVNRPFLFFVNFGKEQAFAGSFVDPSLIACD